MSPVTFFIVSAIVAPGALFVTADHLPACVVFWGVAAIASHSLKIGNTWQRFVVRCMGRPQGVNGMALRFVNPLIDRIVTILAEGHPDHSFQYRTGTNEGYSACQC